MKKQALLLLILVLHLHLAALAQESTSTLSMQTEQEKKKTPLHLMASLTSSSNLYRDNSPDREATTELLLNPSVELSPETSLSLKGTVTREETKARNTILSNTAVSLKTKGPDIGPFECAGGLTGVAPTNEEDRKVNRFQGAAALGGSLKTHWKKLDILYGLTGTRNMHEFTINADGSPNIQYSLGHMLTLDLELSSAWSLSAAGLYKQGWTYRNFQRDSFGIELGANYNVSKTLQLSAGISNEGNALKANGSESNINIYDENTSAIKASVTFVN